MERARMTGSSPSSSAQSTAAEAALEAKSAAAAASRRTDSAPSPTDAAPADELPAVDYANPDYYLNRDLSWLAFNRRVLAQATDAATPLLERVRFLMICASNLDEFFMKRMAMMRLRLRAGREDIQPDGMTLRERIAKSRETVAELQSAMAECWQRDLLPALADRGVTFLSYDDLTTAERDALDQWFTQNVFPVLTPLAVDPGHRFPFISNLSENLGVLLEQEGGSPPIDGAAGERSFARLKIPDALPRLVRLETVMGDADAEDAPPARFVPLEQIVRSNLEQVFRGMRIAGVLPFRVTRSAGVDPEAEEIDDLLEHVEASLRQRRFADPVRIEVVEPEPNDELMALVLEELQLTEHEVYGRRGPLEYADLAAITDLDLPDEKFERWTPITPPRLRDDARDIFSIIRERDIFVHHPYDSFSQSVERFVAAAARDPNVLAIKQTLYRTSRDSPFIDSLIAAAEEGKQVACLVELRARFDEDKNVRFARQLEKHGVHVAYGVVGLKTHCKCSLVVRREADALRCYAHVGTGNYHPGTAQLYTDCGILTCDPAVTQDVVNLFNTLTGRSVSNDYRRLLVAPLTMRPRFLELIDREIDIARNGGEGRIIAKMNALEDNQIIRKLYDASRAGVKITLFVRGFCCLKPGVPGVSENIEIISIIGRFLEHSRIFHFGGGHADPVDGEWLFGSADWMSRNLSDRVEAITPVADRSARKALHRILEVSLVDRRRAWTLGADGVYRRRETDAPTDADPQAESQSDAMLGTFQALMRDAQRAKRAL
jgi:polyphosphate kinase